MSKKQMNGTRSTEKRRKRGRRRKRKVKSIKEAGKGNIMMLSHRIILVPVKRPIPIAI